MLHVSTIFFSMLLGTSAHAFVRDCTALLEGNGPQVAFTIDQQSSGTTLNFAAPVAWSPNALNFKVVHSIWRQEGGYFLAAVAEVLPQNQLLEIRFENSNMDHGAMLAGDQDSTLRGMGKSREYTVECR